jgi:DNA invertase Pin-like site-specific DNA recombinase
MKHSNKIDDECIDSICIYTRVSTKKQTIDKKHGMNYQKELCKKYVDEKYSNVSEISYWDDIGSSYKSKLILNGMNKMIQKIKPNTLIIISEVSRLGRNCKMVENILKIIQKKNCFILSIFENLMFGLTISMNKSFLNKVIDSEKEYNVLSMRIKNTQLYIKRNGGYVGRIPFGYELVRNCKNIPILKEKVKDFKLIDKIVDLYDNTHSYSEIANIMNSKKLLCKEKEWTYMTIKKILTKFYPEHIQTNVSHKTKSVFDKISNCKINKIQKKIINLHMCGENKCTQLRSGKIIPK